jgi:hypothetical protein
MEKLTNNPVVYSEVSKPATGEDAESVPSPPPIHKPHSYKT